MKSRFKVGDEVTAVYQGNVNRHVLLLKVTKVGHKYLHGTTLHANPEGLIREGHETKINIEESIVYPGLRLDLQAAEFKYRGDYQSWKNQKNTRENEISYELRNLVWERLDEWELENPMPQRQELPSQEAGI